MSTQPAPCGQLVSPEYRKTCLEMALKHYEGRGEAAKPETVVAAARLFYDYVYPEAK